MPGGNGATAFTQLFTGEGQRAWKLPSGGAKTYYLYDGDGQVLCELDASGSPVETYAYGAVGLAERFQHTDSGVPYVSYLFDPNGSLAHRVRQDDPNTSSGDAVFAQDVALYDSQGLLHADIDTITGGFNANHLDPVGYKGQQGSYTDVQTLHTASGLYTALSGPGGVYYNPESGVGMSRTQADSANEYSDALNSLEQPLHGAFVGVAGVIGGAAGPGGAALASGLVDGEITYIETGSAKCAAASPGA